MNLFKFFRRSKERHIAFLDGDQPLVSLVAAYKAHLMDVETILVRMSNAEGELEPKILRDLNSLKKICLSGYPTRKEVTDKYLGIMMQQYIQQGYRKLTVVSADLDFLDIFRMLSNLNPNESFDFQLIIPRKFGEEVDLVSRNKCKVQITFS